MHKAVFLDRDGTLNNDPNGYISKVEDFNLFDYSVNALKIFQELGYNIFVVSNQSGIARGIFTEEQLNLIHESFLQDMSAQNINITKIYYCPYHPDGIIEKYRQDSDLRKPQTGMFNLAHKEYDIEKKSSYMIGDKYDDILFAHNAGIKSILVLSGNGKNTLKTLNQKNIKPDFIAETLLTAANLLKLLAQQNNKIKLTRMGEKS